MDPYLAFQDACILFYKIHLKAVNLPSDAYESHHQYGTADNHSNTYNNDYRNFWKKQKMVFRMIDLFSDNTVKNTTNNCITYVY